MTTNRDRAAEVIWDAQASGLAKPRDLADELDDAGLIAPDLPEPRGASPYWKVPTEDGASDALIHPFRKAIVVRLEDGTRTASVLTCDEARGVARALEAAADQITKENTDD